MKLSDKFGLPTGLFDSVRKVFDESTEYQNKVKAHMAKKGIKSLGDLSPEEKKKFFNDLDAAHKAKNEEANICPVCNKEPCECPTGNHINEKKYDFEPEKEPKEPTEDEKKESDRLKAKHGGANKKALDKISKAFAKKKVNEDVSEAVGGGTSVNTQSLKSAAAQKKRADVAVKIASLKLKQEKERESLQKQKSSIKEEFDGFVLDESFSPAMVAKLKAEYGKISTIDPSSDSYKKLIAMLDKMDKKDLQTLADAGIKFVSGLARNRVNRMKNESVEESTGVTDYNAKSQGGTRKELIAKYHKTKNPKDAEAARKAGATQKELQGEEFEVDEACWDTHKQEGMKKKGDKMVPNCVPKNEELEIEEGKSSTGYNLYHKDFSSAMAHAYDFAKNKYGIEVDPEEIDRKVAMGPKKPSSGKTNSYRLMSKDGKKAIQVQVANLDNKRYELNMYKEEVDLEEKVVKGKGYDNPENDRKGPEGKVPMTSLMPGHSDKAARLAAVQAKGRLVKGKAQSAPQKEESDYPEFKQGGEALAKKFEKAFAKMGVKANIKMKTVGNVSVNEAVMKKISKAAKKMKEQAPSNKDVSKSGEPLSGKKEPIEINPEIQQSK